MSSLSPAIGQNALNNETSPVSVSSDYDDHVCSRVSTSSPCDQAVNDEDDNNESGDETSDYDAGVATASPLASDPYPFNPIEQENCESMRDQILMRFSQIESSQQMQFVPTSSAGLSLFCTFF